MKWWVAKGDRKKRVCDLVWTHCSKRNTEMMAHGQKYFQALLNKSSFYSFNSLKKNKIRLTDATVPREREAMSPRTDTVLWMSRTCSLSSWVVLSTHIWGAASGQRQQLLWEALAVITPLLWLPRAAGQGQPQERGRHPACVSGWCSSSSGLRESCLGTGQ